MNSIFAYIIELNIAISVFFISYLILFRRDKNFNNRRRFLLGVIIASAIIPILYIHVPYANPLELSASVMLEELIIM